jgi:hypothetical protein
MIARPAACELLTPLAWLPIRILTSEATEQWTFRGSG